MQIASHSYRPDTTLALALHVRCERNISRPDRLARLAAAHRDALFALSARCHAVVFLPDRIEAVWTLPPSDMTRAARLIAIKRAFAASLDAPPPTGARAGARWQRRLLLRIMPISRPSDMARHTDGCHFAPVRHGWTRRPQDWEHSTIHRAPPSEMILA